MKLNQKTNRDWENTSEGEISNIINEEQNTNYNERIEAFAFIDMNNWQYDDDYPDFNLNWCRETIENLKRIGALEGLGIINWDNFNINIANGEF